MTYTRHDVERTRRGVFLAFAANGFAFASWMSRLPDVKQSLALTPGQQGIMLLAISAGSIVGLPLSGRIIEKVGASRALHLAGAVFVPGLVLALLGVSFGHSHLAVMPGLFLFGLGSGLWDVTQNLEGSVVEQASGHSIMSWFHAAFSGGTVCGALVGAGVVALSIPIQWHLGIVGVCAAGAVVYSASLFSPLLDSRAPAHPEDALQEARHEPARSAWREPRTLLIGIMVLAASFAEGTANDWMAVAFTEGHEVTNSLGVLALAVFLTFMTAGRILGTHLLDRYGRVTVLRALFIAALAGSLLVVFGNTVTAYVGAAIWGCGASLGFPVGMSAAADDPARAAARISVVSTIGYGAFLAGPPFLGFLGDHVGVLHSLLFVAATAILAFIVTPAAKPLAASE